MNHFAPLVDSFDRVHNNLRISVTDRCNIRCFYCMPNENVRFRPRAEILSFEEILRFADVMARCGINKIRLTGGEPLVRSGICDLVQRLSQIPGLDDIAMTTNGILLSKYAFQLKQAGLGRLNISLDAMNEATFERIARRSGLQQVLDGIAAAKQAGFERIRLNTVAISGISEPEIIPLARFAREQNLELRFIEFMPLGAEDNWSDASVLSGQRIREMIENACGPLEPAARDDPSQPAMDFVYADGRGRIGFINPVTQPFCGDCNRLRITAEGQVRNCLFSDREWDVRELLRGDASDEAIADLVRESISQKKAGHGIDSDDFVKPARAMYQIGG